MDKIICLGKNYVEHAKEMGDEVPEKPVLFLKPPSAAVAVNHRGDEIQIALPRNRGSVHHECEIIFRLDSKLQIQAVTLGLDLTLRELQTKLKKQGHPWEISKVFKNSAVIGPWIAYKDFPGYLNEPFSFSLDGKVKQQGKGSEMSFSPEQSLEYIQEHFPLCEGDVIFTGTPQGVGPILPGQKGELNWAGKPLFQVHFL